MGDTSLRRLILGSLLWALSAGATLAVTRTVDDDGPADFNTVQAAITASSSGDVVLVSCGFYPENILMKNGVAVLGAGAECTTLDGTASGTVVTFSFDGPGTELSGFTVQNGLSSLGGGILVDGGTNPTISRNIIRDNRAVLDLQGFFGVGGGISTYESAPFISNNLVVGNSAERTGGGLDMYFGYPELVNNTIVGNESIRPGASVAYGGGVYFLFADPTLTSNIIYDNFSEAGGGGVDVVNSSYTVTYNDLFQNAPVNWACQDGANPCPSGGFPPGLGNVSVDPLLEGVGPGMARYCPRSHSPAVDAGPITPPSDPTDFFGRPRVQDGDFDGTAVVDLGYCETDEVTFLLIDANGLITWDPSINGLAMYNLYRGDFNVLLSSCATDCVYTQDLILVTEARRFCDIPSPSFMDTDVPPGVGEGYFYLVTGEDVAEGGLGWMGSVLRDNDNPCP